tara:strand:+ start:972 stop:1331 length:360 start_codon:yes stop_codon:yes gene_type:complete
MNHLFLLMVCLASIELIYVFKLSQSLGSLLITIKKVIHIIPSKKISDHWKELAVTHYATSIMRSSLRILFMLLIIMLLIITIDIIISDFLIFIFSFNGIVESLVFACLYVFIRNTFKKQ